MLPHDLRGVVAAFALLIAGAPAFAQDAPRPLTHREAFSRLPASVETLQTQRPTRTPAR